MSNERAPRTPEERAAQKAEDRKLIYPTTVAIARATEGKPVDVAFTALGCATTMLLGALAEKNYPAVKFWANANAEMYSRLARADNLDEFRLALHDARIGNEAVRQQVRPF